ncbi:MAG: peptide chain release factor N(5)-glutamine methyltransferase [Chloroflexota bacterium]|nr:peptide chain release factor N(5)-glutamine methyltransferase [Chloroflexota bacterium]
MSTPSLLSNITSRLAAVSETPALDASVLLAHITNRSRTWVLAHPELSLLPEQQKQLDHSLLRLEQGEPLPYVLGSWEFFGLQFDLTPQVLIPRPETELLVERALDWLKESPGRLNVADVGTGSGAIGVSLAVRLPDIHVLATDLSREALQVACGNALKFNVADRIQFVQCDLLPARGQGQGHKKLDLICANLPYIPTHTLRHLPIFGREPSLALDGGKDGLELVRRLLALGPEWLVPGGVMLLELEAANAIQARDLACELFTMSKIHLHHDLANHPRLLEIHLQDNAD